MGMGINVGCVKFHLNEIWLLQNLLKIGNGGFDPDNNESIKGTSQSVHCLLPGETVYCQLYQHGVIVTRDFISLIYGPVQADPMSSGSLVDLNHSWAGEKFIFGIFRIDPQFDGITPLHHLVLGKTDRLTQSDQQLLPDQVNTCHHLGHCVFNLNPGIHFQKVKCAVRLHQEFNCACTEVISSFGSPYCRCTDLLGQWFF